MPEAKVSWRQVRIEEKHTPRGGFGPDYAHALRRLRDDGRAPGYTARLPGGETVDLGLPSYDGPLGLVAAIDWSGLGD
jgi:hypothetical protein